MTRYGLEVIPFGRFSDPREVVKVAQIAEEAGWQELWLWDHLVFPWAVGDPWISLAAVASATQSMKLVTGVAPLPRYRPHLLARLMTSLDLLSAGRLIFGTGLGIASDFTPFGEPESAKTRAAMTDEGLELLAHLWSGQETTHQGPYYQADGAARRPLGWVDHRGDRRAMQCRKVASPDCCPGRQDSPGP
jgi:alkanesulfonate monooxygenase SsuD/methylene tetrahydromethanopterin reductase-like flavin-dependent oxidoreductase (luciferase family)